MYEKDLALNNQQGLICNKTQPNITEIKNDIEEIQRNLFSSLKQKAVLFDFHLHSCVFLPLTTISPQFVRVRTVFWIHINKTLLE